MQIHTQYHILQVGRQLLDCKSKTAHSWAKAHAANIHARVQHVKFSCKRVVYIQLKVTQVTAEQVTKRQL